MLRGGDIARATSYEQFNLDGLKFEHLILSNFAFMQKKLSTKLVKFVMKSDVRNRKREGRNATALQYFILFIY